MAETYCGKTCTSCIQKEALNCPGCKVGPGRQYSGECALAKCCRNKKHQEELSGDFACRQQLHLVFFFLY
jgi:hypothetical protein